MNIYDLHVELSDLVGKTIKEIKGMEKDSEAVDIHTECGNIYRFFHKQDCCENVWLEDFDAEVDDLLGSVVLSAEEVSNIQEDNEWGSQTWTFYKIETNKGGIWMRWCGESNGYYSEDVSFIHVNKQK